MAKIVLLLLAHQYSNFNTMHQLLESPVGAGESEGGKEGQLDNISHGGINASESRDRDGAHGDGTTKRGASLRRAGKVAEGQ
jgi:hypothetical protein